MGQQMCLPHKAFMADWDESPDWIKRPILVGPLSRPLRAQRPCACGQRTKRQAFTEAPLLWLSQPTSTGRDRGRKLWSSYQARMFHCGVCHQGCHCLFLSRG